MWWKQIFGKGYNNQIIENKSICSFDGHSLCRPIVIPTHHVICHLNSYKHQTVNQLKQITLFSIIAIIFIFWSIIICLYLLYISWWRLDFEGGPTVSRSSVSVSLCHCVFLKKHQLLLVSVLKSMDCCNSSIPQQCLSCFWMLECVFVWMTYDMRREEWDFWPVRDISFSRRQT